jgi:O-antigen/teichoic acid export membrane protein
VTLDAGTRRRLTLSLIASYISRFASTLIQLIQVPLFLHFWAAPVFGEWMILNALPNYLSFSNAGFGNVAGNEMQMAESRGDREGALRAFQSCWWLILGTLGAAGSLLVAALWLLPVGRLLRVHAIAEQDARLIAAYLGLAVLLGQVETLLQSAYKCVGRYSYGSALDTGLTLAAFAATMIPVALGYGPRTAALVYAGGSAAGTLVLAACVRHDIPWIRFGWQYASLAELRRQAAPALAFMSFPLGMALNLQGTLIAVGYALGPVAVVVFGTARTVSRVALQMAQMINFSFEPEFAASFARRNTGLLRTLHRRACQMALGLSSLLVVATIAVGPPLLHRWTQGKVPPSRGLLAVLLLVVVLYSLWSTSAAMLTATNRHGRVAGIFLASTSVTVALTWVLAARFGLLGAAWSLLLSELLMAAYVLPATLRLAEDTGRAFAWSLLSLPSALRPASWLKRRNARRS